MHQNELPLRKYTIIVYKLSKGEKSALPDASRVFQLQLGTRLVETDGCKEFNFREVRGEMFRRYPRRPACGNICHPLYYCQAVFLSSKN